MFWLNRLFDRTYYFAQTPPVNNLDRNVTVTDVTVTAAPDGHDDTLFNSVHVFIAIVSLFKHSKQSTSYSRGSLYTLIGGAK